MKKLLILLFPVACWGQDYKRVDTLFSYKDGQIVVVGNKRDTFYYAKMKRDIRAEYVEVFIMDDRRNIGKLTDLCPPDDTTAVKQEVFFSPLLKKYALVTNMGSMYDNVVHGSAEYIEQQKPIEYANALRRKKPVATIKIICK